MYYVYVLKSVNYDQIYTGVTNNLSRRLQEHNSGHSTHTNKYKPWAVISYIAFNDQDMALEFEKYLKTGSGIAFSRKRLIGKGPLRSS